MLFKKIKLNLWLTVREPYWSTRLLATHWQRAVRRDNVICITLSRVYECRLS